MLDRLEAAGIPEPLLRVAVSCYLAACSLDTPTHTEFRWLRWLTESAWMRRQFVEAAIFCFGFPNLASATVPTAYVALLAGSFGQEDFGRVLAEVAAREDLQTDTRMFVAVVAIVALALHGTAEAQEVLGTRRLALSPGWDRVREAVEIYWQQMYEPLPVERIRAELDAVKHQAVVEAAWHKLVIALDQTAAAPFKFLSGTKTRDYLFGPNGSLGHLRDLASRSDGSGVSRWLITEPLDDLGRFLDDATRKATERNDQLIEKGKRRAFLSLLEDVVAAARTVAALPTTSASQEESRRIDAARAVARVVHAHWNQLHEEVAAIAGPERIPLEALLDELRDVDSWGSR